MSEKENIRRRRFLAATATTTAVAGCLGDGGNEVQDSDGDGVIDSEDYAPDDPDVQKKDDISGDATRTVAPTTTERPTAETGTTTRTTTDRSTRTQTASPADANTLPVTDGMRDGESGITAYSSNEVTARIVDDGPSVDRIDASEVKLLVGASRYPRNGSVTYGVSDPFYLSGTQEVTAPVELSTADPPTDQRLHYLAFLLPADVSVENATSEDLTFFHESDPFTVDSDGVTIQRRAHPRDLDDDTGSGYERTAVEGAYHLSFEGSTQGRSWSTGFYIYKSSYLEMQSEPRGRSRSEYVSYAQQDGFAWEIAEILASEAEKNGFTDKRMQVEFVIDFVQNLPYVPDDVSSGYDDYTKFITETITEAGGDCEDTAIMLAAVLQADPFGYDMVLLQPPEHMAAGIYGSDDLSGTYYTYDERRYYYIETTGTGWGIGDIPDAYDGESAYIHQV